MEGCELDVFLSTLTTLEDYKNKLIERAHQMLSITEEHEEVEANRCILLKGKDQYLAVFKHRLAYGDPAMLLTLPGPQLVGPLISKIGIHTRFLQNYRRKKYVGNGTRASWVCIFAKIADKKGTYPIQCFLFNHNDLSQIGVKRTEINTLGMRSAKLAHFVLDRASISRQHLLGYTKSPLKRGFTGAVHVFYRMRPSVSALAVGVSKAAIDYVKENI